MSPKLRRGERQGLRSTRPLYTFACLNARDVGLCQRCGEPGTEIDHVAGPIGGDINHAGNLQLLCAAYHRGKTIAAHRPITDPEHFARAIELRERLIALSPIRECDDHDDWPTCERELPHLRRAEFIAELARISTE